MTDAPTVNESRYMQAAGIADKVLMAGLPLLHFEAVGDYLIFRFGGPRVQTVHMDVASEPDAPKLVAAYLRSPP